MRPSDILFAEKVVKTSGSNDRARDLVSLPRCLVVLWIQESVFTLVFAAQGSCRARCFRELRSRLVCLLSQTCLSLQLSWVALHLCLDILLCHMLHGICWFKGGGKGGKPRFDISSSEERLGDLEARESETMGTIVWMGARAESSMKECICAWCIIHPGSRLSSWSCWLPRMDAWI